MLVAVQPVTGIIGEILTTLMNSQIVRGQNRLGNKAPASNAKFESQSPIAVKKEPIELFETVVPQICATVKVNDVLELSSFLNSGKIDMEDLTVARHGKICLKLCNNTLQISQPKNGLICIQRRGFRTRTYQARAVDKPNKGPTSFLSYLGITSKIKTAWQKSLKEDSIKAILDSPDLKGPEKIKVAFAEGYFAAQQNKKKVPWFGMLSVTLTIIGIGYILFGNFVQFRIGGAGISQITPEDVSVTFKDVRGIDEAKEEVMKIVDYLKDPVKYTRLGARLPKGILLVGLPGCGKTLLAKAIAGEAQVPFFRTSGSEFEEMLVGLGAKRVRDLFTTARGRAPCVIFIDEIDSIGAKRSYSAFHPYANQTINQLLTEMDGFLSSSGVIVLAATNRRQDLDPALLRPGRFDVEVQINHPDLKGRVEIFDLYLEKITKDADVNVEKLAKTTIGFSGADIENMVNQAALKAAADNKVSVDMHYLDMAHDLVAMGPAKKSLPTDKDVNSNTAYHEAGHALVAFFTKDAVPLHKVTIVPRGSSLGHTSFRPDKEMYSQTKSQLLADLDVFMGGRAAEEIIFGPDKVSTGIKSDLKGATSVAEHMVKEYGMSDKTGFRYFNDSNLTPSETSPITRETVDGEIKRLLQEAYERAKNILKNNAPAHKRLADALLQYETLNAEEIKLVIEGQPLNKLLVVTTSR